MSNQGVYEKIRVFGGELVVYSFGEGPAVIFLHGGPGDTHHYMKRMARPLFNDFQCIFFDQRGTGGSTSFERDPAQFSLELLFEDLLAVKKHFNCGPTALVGHSWGAMYALFFYLRLPEQFKKTALLNIGPLDTEMGKKMSTRLTSNLNEKEIEEWSFLRSSRNNARDQRQFDTVEALDKKIMRLRVKAWVFNPELWETFLNEYFQDPPPDREVNKWIWDDLDGRFSWDQLIENQTPAWICVGANDSVPIIQAQRIVEMMPNTHLTIFENCGHIPWLERPKKFYTQLKQFLSSAYKDLSFAGFSKFSDVIFELTVNQEIIK